MKKSLLFVVSCVILFNHTQLKAQTPWLVGGNALSANGRFGTITNHSVIFRTAGIDRGILTNNGQWGIGTNLPAPGSQLHASGNQTLSGNLFFPSGWNYIQFANSVNEGNPMIYMFTNGDVNHERMVLGHSPTPAGFRLGLSYRDDLDRFDFRNHQLTTLSIGLADGLVGVGTRAPQRRLHVVNNGSGTTPNVNSPFVVENNTNNYISALAPAASERGILFGDPSDPQDGGIIYHGGNNELQFRTNGNFTRMVLKQDGNVGIGTTDTKDYRLAVNGNAIFTEVRVKPFATWPDYVFDPTYPLPSLTDIDAYIKLHKHLPDIPSAQEVGKEGINLGSNQAQLLRKIEELTLYIIEINKKIEGLQQENAVLKSAMVNLHK